MGHPMADLIRGSERGPTGDPVGGGPVRGGPNQHLISERERTCLGRNGSGGPCLSLKPFF